MKSLIDQGFLLNTQTACSLYHGYAEKMPIMNYHCHVNPADIAKKYFL